MAHLHVKWPRGELSILRGGLIRGRHSREQFRVALGIVDVVYAIIGPLWCSFSI